MTNRDGISLLFSLLSAKVYLGVAVSDGVADGNGKRETRSLFESQHPVSKFCALVPANLGEKKR